MMDYGWSSAGAIAAAVESGAAGAGEVIDQTLQRIDRRNTVLNAITTVLRRSMRCRV